MSSTCWNRVPIPAVAGVLRHLDTKDALAAASTCRAWRSALCLYNTTKESLHLTATPSQLEKNMFYAQIYRKHVKCLTVVLECTDSDLETFLQFVLIRFCQARSLQEIILIATPTYLKFEEKHNIEKLRSLITDKLLRSQKHSLRQILLHGCGGLLPLEIQDPEDMDFINLKGIACTNVRNYENSLCLYVPVRPFPISSLQKICIDYNSIDEVGIEGLANLPHLRHLALNLLNVPDQRFHTIPWAELHKYYDLRLQVTLNVINLPVFKLEEVRRNVLVREMPLAAFRVFFCKVLHLGVINHLQIYSQTLQELQWTDSHFDRVDSDEDIIIHPLNAFYDLNISPFMIICWQCVNLRKLVIHGYWISAYDLLGMARLRNRTLDHLEVSALAYDMPGSCMEEANEYTLPQAVYCDEDQDVLGKIYVDELNSVLINEWQPTNWNTMHKALGPNSTENDQLSYILQETTVDIQQQLGVT